MSPHPESLRPYRAPLTGGAVHLTQRRRSGLALVGEVLGVHPSLRVLDISGSGLKQAFGGAASRGAPLVKAATAISDALNRNPRVAKVHL